LWRSARYLSCILCCFIFFAYCLLPLPLVQLRHDIRIRCDKCPAGKSGRWVDRNCSCDSAQHQLVGLNHNCKRILVIDHFFSGMGTMDRGLPSLSKLAAPHKLFESFPPHLDPLSGQWYPQAAVRMIHLTAQICGAAFLTPLPRRHGSKKASMASH
jgi:hypothetical protein